jgi:copper(I)-binding protein
MDASSPPASSPESLLVALTPTEWRDFLPEPMASELKTLARRTQVIDPTTTTSTPESAAIGGTYMTVERIDIPGFTDMKFIPGGNQLLLSGLTSPLVIGEKIPITLQFERAGAITIQAEVQPYTVIADRVLPPRLKLPGQ